MPDYKKAFEILVNTYNINVSDERFGDGFEYHLTRKDKKIHFIPLANKETYDFFKECLEELKNYA